DPPAQRIRRGINRIQYLPVGESVEFNKFGQAVGKWQFLFGKYVGTRTRRLISILKKNWKDVTKEEKNFLWFDIKEHFRLENDDVKKQTLLSCGTKWKAFKTRLRNENTTAKNKLYAQAPRAPRDKVGIKPLPAELIDVSKKLAQAASELSQSSNESKSGVDPLIMVLGPEHGGRTRGSVVILGIKRELKDMLGKRGPLNNEKIMKRYA
nr:hypothetical protein [Tanacetum cinerariifolium]